MIQLNSIDSTAADNPLAAPLSVETATGSMGDAFALLLAARAPVEELAGRDLPVPGKPLPVAANPLAAPELPVLPPEESMPWSVDAGTDGESDPPHDTPVAPPWPEFHASIPFPDPALHPAANSHTGVPGRGLPSRAMAEDPHRAPTDPDHRGVRQQPDISPAARSLVAVAAFSPRIGTSGFSGSPTAENPARGPAGSEQAPAPRQRLPAEPVRLPDQPPALMVPMALRARIVQAPHGERTRGDALVRVQAVQTGEAVAPSTHSVSVTDRDRSSPNPASAPVTIPVSAAAQSTASAHSPQETWAPMPAAAAAEAFRPHDFATLVDRLTEARETARGGFAELAVNHAEFGKVSLSFRQEDGGLTVGLSASDPEFAQAVSAAMPVERASQADAGFAGNRREGEAQSQQGRAASGDASSSGEGRQRGQRDLHDHQRQSVRDPAPRGGGRPQGGARGGIFA